MFLFKKKSILAHFPTTRPEKRGMLSPSNLEMATACRGQMVLNYADDSPEHPVATRGKELHALAEKALKFTYRKKLVKRLKLMDDEDFVNDYVLHCYKMSIGADLVGGEVLLEDNFFNNYIIGYVDFIAFNRKLKKITIRDLKTGYKPIADAAKYQLFFYALGAINALRYPIETFDLAFYTRYGIIKHSVTHEELIKFKSYFSRDLAEFSFKFGPHCGDCYQYKGCTFAQLKTRNFIKKLNLTKDPAITLKNMEYKKTIEKYFDLIKEQIIAKCEASPSKKWKNFKTNTTTYKYWKKDKLEEIEALVGAKKLPSPSNAMQAGMDIEGLYDPSEQTRLTIVRG